MEGNRSLIAAVLLGWLPAVTLLFRLIGPRRATLVSVLGGYLFLPSAMLDAPGPDTLQVGRLVAIGAGLLLGILGRDARALRRARPHPFDWAIIAYTLYPLTGYLVGGRMLPWDVADMILQRGLSWLPVYLAARLYLGDAAGHRSVGLAVIVGALVLVPVCAIEAAMGPRWYLGGLIYGLPYHPTMVDRLGGWRPEAFFHNGLHLAAWMALAAVLATWFWLAEAWPQHWGPGWWPAVVLVSASLACRGIYGYLTLGLGLSVTLLTRAFRTRLALFAPAGLALLYIGMRASGSWDARALTRFASMLGRPGTIGFRIGSEDGVISSVLSTHPVLGYGLHIWHLGAVGQSFLWPDGWWLQVLWEGGLVGLSLHLLAFHLWPTGLVLTRPTGRPGAIEAMSPTRGLALFTLLHMADSLHNQSPIVPTVLIAGALVGRATRRVGSQPAGPGPQVQRVAYRPVGLATDPSAIPGLAGLACLLYIFGHGPVSGHEAAKLVGGLGAGLLFASAGAAGAWASERVPLRRLALFATLFALLGVSFNLALHPSTRPAANADLLQGMALAGLAVAGWRKAFGAHAAGDAVLAALPLAAHFLIAPRCPADLPGVQYLIAGPGETRSLFPLCPWLTLAALGAWSTRVGPASNLWASALFGASAAWAWWKSPEGAWPSKFPMDLSYALLSCSAATLAMSLSGALRPGRYPSLVLAWLGRRWLLFFYLHFAVASLLRRAEGLSPWTVWLGMAFASLGATWLVSEAMTPMSRWLRGPATWGPLLAIIVIAAALPGLPPWAVSGLAGFAGLAFAARYEILASLVLDLRGPDVSSSTSPRKPVPRAHRMGSASNDLPRNTLRLAIVLILLATPELLLVVERWWRQGQGERPARTKALKPGTNLPHSTLLFRSTSE